MLEKFFVLETNVDSEKVKSWKGIDLELHSPAYQRFIPKLYEKRLYEFLGVKLIKKLAICRTWNKKYSNKNKEVDCREVRSKKDLVGLVNQTIIREYINKEKFQLSLIPMAMSGGIYLLSYLTNNEHATQYRLFCGLVGTVFASLTLLHGSLTMLQRYHRARVYDLLKKEK